jgi:hypothetical protein
MFLYYTVCALVKMRKCLDIVYWKLILYQTYSNVKFKTHPMYLLQRVATLSPYFKKFIIFADLTYVILCLLCCYQVELFQMICNYNWWLTNNWFFIVKYKIVHNYGNCQVILFLPIHWPLTFYHLLLDGQRVTFKCVYVILEDTPMWKRHDYAAKV